MFSISIVFVLLACLKHYSCQFTEKIVEIKPLGINALINLSPTLNLYLSWDYRYIKQL